MTSKITFILRAESLFWFYLDLNKRSKLVQSIYQNIVWFIFDVVGVTIKCKSS